jgi:hypothetical protein
VVLFAANEPITISGSRAQRILQRRINQAVAEVLQTLEPVLGWANREWMSNRSLLLLMAISGRGRPEPDGRS